MEIKIDGQPILDWFYQSNKIAAHSIQGVLIESSLMNEATKAVKEVVEENARLKHLLGQIIQDLPSNKDWLNPDIEREAIELLTGSEAHRKR